MGSLWFVSPEGAGFCDRNSRGLVMSHVVVIGVGVVSLYFGYRWVRREFERVEQALRRADRRIRREKSTSQATTLAFDAINGVYRPAD